MLWESLAAVDGSAEISHVTVANSWAVDAGMAARRALRTNGHLTVRGTAPPAPYIHHGAVL